jgi:hypothetical protein
MRGSLLRGEHTFTESPAFSAVRARRRAPLFGPEHWQVDKSFDVPVG